MFFDLLHQACPGRGKLFFGFGPNGGTTGCQKDEKQYR
jgi:hypothetical protein